MTVSFTDFITTVLAPYSEENLNAGKNSWHAQPTWDDDKDIWGSTSLTSVTSLGDDQIVGFLPRLSINNQGKVTGKLRKTIHPTGGLLWLSALEAPGLEESDWSRLVNTLGLYGADTLASIFPTKEYTAATRAPSRFTVNAVVQRLLKQVENNLICREGHIYTFSDTDAVIVRVTIADMIECRDE